MNTMEQQIQIKHKIERLLKGMDNPRLADLSGSLMRGVNWRSSKRDHMIEGVAEWIVTGKYTISPGRLPEAKVEDRWGLFVTEAMDAFRTQQTKLEEKLETIELRVGNLKRSKHDE